MIKRLNIKCFGSFSEFDWHQSVEESGTVQDFKKLNILYGRNYSGKTTISRVIRSFEVGRLPDNYKDNNFELITDTESLSQDNILENDLDIRVYNRDFIDENLSFLKDSVQGEIQTFAIIGSDNKKLEEQIASREKKLGSVEAGLGLRFELELKKKYFNEKDRKSSQMEQGLAERLRRRANDEIKPNRIYGFPGYNISSIKTDIREIRKQSYSPLASGEVRLREELLKAESLPDIENEIKAAPQFERLRRICADLAGKKISPSKPIQELLNDALLQTWVKTGMAHHREKRETCGFCGQALPSDLWQKLDAHFDKESSELELALNEQIDLIKAELAKMSALNLPEKDRFYASERTAYEELRRHLEKTAKAYQVEAKKLLKVLEARKNNIFQRREMPSVTDYSSELSEKISIVKDAIDANNKKTGTLPQDQNMAREELRLSAVASYIKDIKLEDEEKKIATAKTEAADSKKVKNAVANDIIQLEKENEADRVKLRDEKKGAEKVNEYLNHFFGHEGLRLVATEGSKESKYRFQIMRGDDPAYNMSEGECSLVAFCYFVARLEDTNTSGKDLMIYIDDPISSLDSNHIFFVFSLIESLIAKPEKNLDGLNRYRYHQLFISTHNLDFFKYLKRLSVPSKSHGGKQFFLVEKEGVHSTLRVMPKYLKDYQTEFHYLFHQIYKCRDSGVARVDHEVFYNFGNNLRKFLEAYLFYKYPFKDESDSSVERLRKFFGGDSAATALTNRVSNELSHLEEIFDRSMRPVEVPEIPTVANFVLDKMYEKDRDQFNALLKSIGEPERPCANQEVEQKS